MEMELDGESKGKIAFAKGSMEVESSSSSSGGRAGAAGEEEEEPRKHRKLLLGLDGPEKYARSYQLEAFEKAQRENTIVFLETGSGKTLIAIMLLRSYAYMLRKPSPYIAVFLVPTVVLVDQQAKAVRMHTDLKVGMFYGELNVDLWDAATWKEKLEQFQVFVMTPQILLDNLRHTFVDLAHIKLLIFDECHHARGRSPYACIMTEFYHQLLKLNSVELPRIFGMTASLINSKGSNSRVMYKKHILELESLMNSKVYTVVDESVLSPYISFPTIRLKMYKHMDIPYHLSGHLTEHLKRLKIKHVGALQDNLLDSATEESLRNKITKLHATFLFCLTELGVWLAAKAADALSCKEIYLGLWGQQKDRIGENAVRMFSHNVSQVLSSYVSKEVAIGDDLKADVDAGLLTAKVCCLVQSLLQYRDVCGLRCIVFVERVITAIVIQSLLSSIKQLSSLGTQYMAGSHSGLQSQSRKEQMKIVDAFHEGKVNIIVTTQILEEGLDVQSCNLVIRFDPSATVRSFVQSRGRARTKGSDYVLIVRSGDTATMSKVADFCNSGDIIREESIKLASLPCDLLQSNISDEETYHVEATGAIVTLNSSVALIYFYCSSLPSDGYFKPSPRFNFHEDTGKCTLYLPKSCPIQIVHAEGKISMVKQIVCLEACKKLHKIGALTDLLLPAYCEEIADDAQENGVHSYKEEQVDYFPGELVDSWSSFCSCGLYYCYKITITQSFKYDSSFIDMILIVKTTLGSDLVACSFNLEVERGSLTVHLEYVGVVHLSREQVMMAKHFQMNVLNLLLHHDYVKFMDRTNCLQGQQVSLAVAYLLVPSVGGKIDWHCVRSSTIGMEKIISVTSCFSREKCHLIPTLNGPLCSCTLQNSVVYTPHNGKFYCISGTLDCNANSSLTLKSGEVLSYKEYYQSRHGINLIHENESLLAGRHLFKVQNFLLRRTFRKKNDCSTAGVELPPEICMVTMSPISVDTLYTFSFAPSIMHRIQCLLLAARLKNHLAYCTQGHTISAFKVLEAITTKKCLEEFSLESLETLGDSFLKYAASHYLYKSYKHQHEGILSSKKEKLISNASLCRLGCHHNLVGFIRTEAFNANDWIIPGSCVDYFVDSGTCFQSSKGTYIRGRRYIKSKIIADAIEALLGAYLVAAGEPAAFALVNVLGMEMELPKNTIIEKQVLERPEMYINIKDLESLLNYSFKYPSLLVEALTHGSYQIPDVPGCYQRLEFLGDAVLDHLITLHLYSKYPGITPGLLTDLRSASVNNDCYAHAAVKAGLNKYILHASSELHKQMSFYLNHFGHSFCGSSYGWESGAALPKVLGDIIESIAGAIYIDSGCNKHVVWESIKPLLEPIVSPETIEYHPVRELEELCSCKSYTKSYSLTFQDGVASMTVEVESDGIPYRATRTGPNKKTAKKLAAKAVLEALKA